jgi:ATP/maltotriose-dependent transcriptional regulator MalT
MDGNGSAAGELVSRGRGHGLLATKLYVPALRSGLVARRRLDTQLDGTQGRGVVLVIAPAGYGKTVLLTDWVRRQSQPVAWLSLDVGDNDPARFWRHAIAALEDSVPGVVERVEPLLDSPVPGSFESLATGLINELVTNSAHGDTILVLDDYHLIDSADVHASLSFLMEHRPPGLRLMLAGRSDPPLGLARLRGRGELAEVRAADLRFTASEATEFLDHIAEGHGEPLPEAMVSALVARTEGWAVGLQLAGLSLRGQPDVEGFVLAFTGSHRHVLDYLTEEVLDRQSDEIRTFLLDTSVLERLSGSLCDAVTGRGDSQTLLQWIEHAGLFVTPLDEVRGWWRYHHLFADLMRARLEQDPDRSVRLHTSAAGWYKDRGLLDEAIHHALAAHDPIWAAHLIEEHFDMVFNFRGEEATIRRWLDALPKAVLRSRARLLLAEAQMASMRGDIATVELNLDAAEQAYETTREDEFEPTTGKAGSLLANVPAMIALQRSYLAQLRSDPEGTAEFASQANGHLGEGEEMPGLAIEGFFGVAAWLRGNLTEAERAFTSNRARWREAGQSTGAAWADYSLARLQRAQGRLDASDQTCRHALALTAEPGRRPMPATGPALVGLAEVAYLRNELDAALEHVSKGIALCRMFVHTPPLAAGLVTLGWVRQAYGDPDGAREAIWEAARLSPGPAGLFNPVPAEQARLILTQGDLAGTARWTESCGLDVDDEPDYPREPGHLVLARLLLAQRRPGPAVALLDRLHSAAVAQSRTASVIEIKTLRALGLDASGDETGAIVGLGEALVLACPQGNVRMFVDEGPPMADLLGRLVAAQRTQRAAAVVPLNCLVRLQRAFSPPTADSTSRDTAKPRLVEQLTRRELEVLEMLAAGRSNQTIAADLVVSLDTVKKHVSHVLGKLGATNRTEAVARARELDLIS